MDLEKMRSIGHLRSQGKSEKVVERTEKSTVVHEKHWDGRVDATVTPDPVRFAITAHGTGSKKGQPAEVKRMTEKERRERYGESG